MYAIISFAASTEVNVVCVHAYSQDKLRRTLMRLEVLELIQLQVESLEEEAAQAAAAVAAASNDDSTLGASASIPPTGSTMGGTEWDGLREGVGANGGLSIQPIKVPDNVTFEDIMDTAQELRVLVAKR